MAEAIEASVRTKLFERARWERLADQLAIAVAVSLPWSTSATGILVVLWIAALLPTLDRTSLRRALATPAAGLAVTLWALGLLGMLWTNVDFAERLHAFNGFHKLLVIPLLIVQFRRSNRGMWVAGGFLVSCTALLALSFAHRFFYPLPGHWGTIPGMPVKEYIVQSGEFLLCAYGLGHAAISTWRSGRRAFALALVLLAFIFVGNVVYVVASRAMLVSVPFLVAALGWQRFGWKGCAALLAGGAVLAAAIWASSPYLRSRVIGALDEVALYETQNAATSSGYRLEMWKKSIEFIAAAPLVGHGTGSIEDLFRRAAVGKTGVEAAVTANPHNQILVVAIQFGLIGVVVLCAMWIAHLFLFRGASLPAWLGLGVVVQNIVASGFNSQLFYFTPGWTYVFGVGVLGGMVLAQSDPSGWRAGANAANEEATTP
jgi:O-antigen ligase